MPLVNFKSICLHQSLQAHLETLALSRLQDLRIILGRLALDCQFQTASRVVSSSSGGISPRRPWLAHQPQEVGSDAHTTPRAPRFCIEYPVNDSATSCTETERHSSFNQASFGQTSSSVSQSDSQLDNADTRSDICNLSGLSIYSTPVLLQESDADWDHSRPLDQASLKELQWWYVNIRKWNDRSLLPSTPNQTMFVDASNTAGWGCSWKHYRGAHHGYWTMEEAVQSINWRELKAAHLALKTFPIPRNSAILIRTDNTTSLFSYINKQGGTRSLPLINLATEEVWNRCIKNQIMIQAQHIQGLHNTIADLESRRTYFIKNQQWQILPTVFQQINQLWVC